MSSRRCVAHHPLPLPSFIFFLSVNLPTDSVTVPVVQISKRHGQVLQQIVELSGGTIDRQKGVTVRMWDPLICGYGELADKLIDLDLDLALGCDVYDWHWHIVIVFM